MITKEEFEANLNDLRSKIEDACELYGRKKESISILPVTKNWPSDAVKYCKDSGLIRVGENRVQEALVKLQEFPDVDYELIGHLQGNKAKLAVGNFKRIQTIDSLKILQKVAELAQRKSIIQRILIQVNSGNDPAKFGVSLEDAELLVEHSINMDYIEVEGLMTIAPLSNGDSRITSHCFSKLRKLRDELLQNTGANLDELSMGMSGDLKTAIAEGSTMIRVGSALFGKREN